MPEQEEGSRVLQAVETTKSTKDPATKLHAITIKPVACLVNFRWVTSLAIPQTYPETKPCPPVLMYH